MRGEAGFRPGEDPARVVPEQPPALSRGDSEPQSIDQQLQQLAHAGGLEIGIETLDSKDPEAQLARLQGPEFQKDFEEYTELIHRLDHALLALGRQAQEAKKWDLMIQEVGQKGEIDDDETNWDPRDPVNNRPPKIGPEEVVRRAHVATTRRVLDSGENSMLIVGGEMVQRLAKKYGFDFDWRNELDRAVHYPQQSTSADLIAAFTNARKLKIFDLTEQISQAK